MLLKYNLINSGKGCGKSVTINDMNYVSTRHISGSLIAAELYSCEARLLGLVGP